jgi:prenyltransferase beta subunit
MWTRRQFLSRGGLGVLGVSGAALAFPGDAADAGDAGERLEGPPDGSASRGMVTAESEKAIERGLAYLAAYHERDRSGAFGTRNWHGNAAITSLAGLAFMAAGNQPERGKYGRLLSRTLNFVLGLSQADGRFPGYLWNQRATPQGPMYGHGFATLFLGEVVGMVHSEKLRDEVREKLKLALQLIVKSQNPQGGWRYHPYSHDADVSVTVCQIMALRSARNAGFAVPKECVTRCIRYVKLCQDRTGGFNYTVHGGGPHGAFARTGAALSALYSAGVYSGPEIDRGLRYLATCKPGGGGFFRPDMQYFYGHYYAAQAMWTAGGQWWADWFPAIRDVLVQSQNQDGSWDDQIDTHYATAMACIMPPRWPVSSCKFPTTTCPSCKNDQ